MSEIIKRGNKCFKHVGYDQEYNVFSPDGNRARNLKELEPHVDRICEKPLLSQQLTLLGVLLGLLAKILAFLKPKPPEPIDPEKPETTPEAKPEAKKPTIEEWAESIKVYEGWFEGSRSWRNSNPGNLRFVYQFGAIEKDDKNFAVFDSYASGWNALIRQLQRAIHDPSVPPSLLYGPEMTFVEFFAGIPDKYLGYAPKADGNDPVAYALFVTQRLGVDPQTKIGTLR